MTAEQRQAAQHRALTANDKQLRPHPRGLPRRVADALDDAELIAADALDDAELIAADPHASPEAKETARQFAAGLVAALTAQD